MKPMPLPDIEYETIKGITYGFIKFRSSIAYWLEQKKIEETQQKCNEDLEKYLTEGIGDMYE